MTDSRLVTILSHNWWVLLLRGIAAVVFGIFALLQPGISLGSLLLLFGIYTLADGVLGIWTALVGRKGHEHWWLLLLRGGVGISVGMLALMAPGITALALLFYIAVWAISTGVLEIALAIRLRKEIEGEWQLIFAGIMSVLFGYFMLARPGMGALALLWIVAVFSIFFGVLLILLALKLRKLFNVISE